MELNKRIRIELKMLSQDLDNVRQRAKMMKLYAELDTEVVLNDVYRESLRLSVKLEKESKKYKH